MVHHQTRGKAIDARELNPGDSVLNEVRRRLGYKRFDGSMEYFLSEDAVKKWVQNAIAQTLLQVSASIERPFLVGQIVPVLDKTLGDESIVSSQGWQWLQAHKAVGTIGKEGSPATLADERLKFLFLKLGKTKAQWEGGETVELVDIRGRCLIVGGQGEGLSDRQLWEDGGEESHAPTVAETAFHGHGGGDHAHVLPLHERDDWSYTVQPPGVPNMVFRTTMGPSNMSASPSGPIVTSEGGNQPFNVMQPYFAVPVLIFLGVLAT